MSIVRRIKNCIIVGGMNFLSLFSRIKKETITSNYLSNKKAWDKYVSGLKYIDNQPSLTDIKYGQYSSCLSKMIFNDISLNASFNSCEVIAVQNALIALGLEKNPINFPELISFFEKKGTVLKGYFGTAPVAIKKYLKSKQIKIKKLPAIEENFASSPVQILIYQNGQKITSGIHTICIISENGKPRFLNGKPSKYGVPILLLSLSKRAS